MENDDLDDVRGCLEVNFFGVVQLTQAALPNLRESGGRVVTISSVGGVVGRPFNEAYCAAKCAVEGFMESLAPVATTAGCMSAWSSRERSPASSSTTPGSIRPACFGRQARTPRRSSAISPALT
jgi:hypothetical protein